MDQALFSAVDGYIESLFQTSDPDLAHALKSSHENGLPDIHVSSNQGKLLYLLAKLIGAKRILEIGTLGGFSTISLARAVAAGGRVTSLEFEPKHAEVAEQNLQHAGLADKVQIVVGEALKTLGELDESELFDMVFIDADKNNYPGYLEWSLRLTRPGGLIVADNIVRGGAVIDADSEDPMVQGVREFNTLLSRDARAESLVVQLVGAKGYDGLAIIRRV